METGSVGAILSERARISPEMEAIHDIPAGRRLTYREINEGANRVAGALSAMVAPGDRVALLAANAFAYAEILFAVAKLGAILVPLNWRLAAPELAYQIADCTPVLLIHDEAHRLLAEQLAAGGHGTRPLAIGNGTGRTLSAMAARSGAGESLYGGSGDDAWLILYTSGTTGRPKGAVHTHASSLAWCNSALASFESRLGDRQLLLAPLFHIAGVCLLLHAAHRGATTVLTAGFDPAEVWRLIERERISFMFAVPTMINMMREQPERDRWSHDTLRWIMCGAAPVPVTLIDIYAGMGIEIHQVYGSTESHGGIAILPPAYASSKKGSTGVPCFGAELRVVDRDGNDLPPGEKGELVTRGPYLFREYWGLPEHNESAFRDGWFYMGDIGDIDEDGFITIRDRSKDMIISGGENVYPAEIEDVLLRDPGILEAAVIGEPDELWGETVLAVVVRRDGCAGTVVSHEADLAGLCSERLGRFKQPRRYVFVDALPRNASGKVLKHVLRAELIGDRQSQAGSRA